MKTQQQCAQPEQFTVTGKVRGHRNGYGFLATEQYDDLFLPKEIMSRVMHGDTAEFYFSKKPNGKYYIRLNGIQTFEYPTMVGRIESYEGKRYIRPDHYRVGQAYYVPSSALAGAQSGEYVLFERIDDPGAVRCHLRVVERLGRMDSIGFEHRYAMATHGLTMRQVSGHGSYEIGQWDTVFERKDLTDRAYFSIDPENSRDLDDCLYMSRTESGYFLSIAIADASSWVAPASDLNQNAQRQSGTIYLPTASLPMLPNEISEGQASLVPGDTRSALVLDVQMDSEFKVIDKAFVLANICSHAKLSYQMIERNEGVETVDSEVLKGVENLLAWEQKMRESEPESEIVEEHASFSLEIDPDTLKLSSISVKARELSSRAVERAMLLYNDTMAEEGVANGLPLLFKAHGGLDDKYQPIADQLLDWLMKRPGDDLRELEKFLPIRETFAKQKMSDHYLALLRKMLKPSRWSLAPEPHFGMGKTQYLTATSPLRRFADLHNQRVFKAYMMGCEMRSIALDHQAVERLNISDAKARGMAQINEKMIKLEYVSRQLRVANPQPLVQANIISIDKNGFMVKTEDMGLIGYIHKGKLPTGKVWIYDPILMWAESLGERYHIGRTVTVRPVGVDWDTQNLELQWIGPAT